MSEWGEVVLGDLCERVTVGHVGKMADQYVEDGVPFLRSQNVKPFIIDPTGMLRIDEGFHKKLAKSTLAAGDVVVVRTGYPGTAAVVPPAYDGANCADLVVMTPGPHLNPHLLAAIFNSSWGRSAVGGQLVGAAQQHFNVGSAKGLRVRLPNRGVQDQIAGVLCAFHDLIEHNRRRVELLEEMSRAIYREWFVHFRYPGHETATFVDSPLGPIPDGWRVGTVDDLVTQCNATVDPRSVDDSTPAVGLEHIPRRQLTLDAWGSAAELSSRKAAFSAGDILFGKIRPYFHKASVAPIDGICSTDAIVLRPHAKHWGQAVLTVASDEFVANAVQTSNGTKMPRADWKVVREFTVAIPPESLSNRFTEIAMRTLNHAQALMFQARCLGSVRDLLLPRLVTGRIDVSSVDLEGLVAGSVS